MATSKIPEGNLETIHYTDGVTNENYVLSILNNQLIEWFEDSSPKDKRPERGRNRNRDRDKDRN